MLFNLIDKLFEKINPKSIYLGRQGEKLIIKKLEKLNIKGKILNNIYIPKRTGGTAEIDVMFITEKGIFVIESKNYSGRIQGDSHSYKWSSTLMLGRINSFYNPILQNENHINHLKQYIGISVPLHSIVVFSNRCRLNVEDNSMDVPVVKRKHLNKTIRKIWNRTETDLDEQKLAAIFRKLEMCTNVSDEVKEEHIKSIYAY